ncbi:MAG: hypothetical protein SFX18_13300 [Pirellulales bacterium]|nr:hypothetical protein [Pirellulales bacterium]
MQLNRIVGFTIGIKAMIKIPRRHIARIRERILQGVCLLCDEPHAKRGLCHRHANAYYQRWWRLGDDEKRQLYEARCISKGLILPTGAIRQIKSTNPFSEA